MQQAARVSQRTAFFHLGKLVEVDSTRRRFSPIRPISEPKTTSPVASARYRRSGACPPWNNRAEHTVRSYEEELCSPQQQDCQDGRSCGERSSGSPSRPWTAAIPDLAANTIGEDEEIDQLQRDIEEQAVIMIARRQPMAYDLRQIMAALRISSRISSGLATLARTSLSGLSPS